MHIRTRALPEGWYPSQNKEAEAYLSAWSRTDSHSFAEKALAAIAPHAGWLYSGRIAWSAWLSAIEAEEVLIIGGHLSAGTAFRFWAEDAFDSPFGNIQAAEELRAYLLDKCKAAEDRSIDNTIEVHMAMMAYRFPGIKLACFRAPNDQRGADIGEAAAQYAISTGKKLFVLGSTDLTHYGRSYGFEPAGPGAKGFAWARKKDEALIESFLNFNTGRALLLAEKDKSACSVGAAIAAMSYAKKMGSSSAKLLMRGSSDEMHPNAEDSVSYCSVAYLAKNPDVLPGQY